MRLLTIRNLCAAAVLSVAVTVPFLPASRLQPQRFALELQVVSSVMGRAQVYFGDGTGFAEANSTTARIDAVGERQTIRLPVLPGRWTELRLDPLEGAGRVAISSPRVVAQDGTVLRTLPLESFTPIRHIEALERRDETVDFVVPAGSDDPQFVLALEPPLEIPRSWRQFATTVGPLVLGVFLVLLGSLIVLQRTGRFRGRTPPIGERTVRSSIVVAVVLAIIGVRLAVIERFGSDLPFWDQWSKEVQVYLPWVEHGEWWRNVVSPHNEHRVVPTVVLNFALLLIGGQWDARVQCVVNAVLPAAIAAALVLLAARRLGRGWALGVGTIALLLLALPLAWENTIAGFQSQFYFVIAFSLAAMGGLLGWPVASWRWWVAVAAGAVALVSMGSGFFWTLPVATIALLRLGRREIARREAIVLVAVSAAFLVAGWSLRADHPPHDVLHARSAGDFLRYATQCLAWPRPELPVLAAVIWVPWIALLVLRLRGKAFDRTLADFVLAVGAWVLLNAAAVAYARGGSGGPPSSRYGDVFALGPLTGVAALAAMTAGGRRVRATALAYGAVVAAAAVVTADDALTRALPARRAEYAAFEETVRDFLDTDDYATFAQRPLPFPTAEELARVLRHPAIRAILPASVRSPQPLPGFRPARAPEPSLHSRGTRFVNGPSRWESAPLPRGRGWWKIETAGSVGQPDATLDLVAIGRDDRVLGHIVPSKPPGRSWRAAYVRAPREPAVFVAQADSMGKWLAFGEPVEVSSLSYWAWQMAKYGLLIACLALAAAAVVVMLWPASADSGVKPGP